eukprot:1433251-Pyramimonas_sp.AAC.2
MDAFAANVAEGIGADAPALAGLTSLQRKCVILALERGKEMIMFPQEAHIRCKWARALRFSAWRSASSHVVIPLAEFEGAERANYS